MSNLLTPAEVEAIRQRTNNRDSRNWYVTDAYEGAKTMCVAAGPMAYPLTDADWEAAKHACDDIPRLLTDREVLAKALSEACLLMEQVLDDDEPFLARSSVEDIEKFLEQVADTGFLAQVEGREP